MRVKEARESIQRAIDTEGQFSHNIISSVLRSVASRHGTRTANALVRDFALTALYGINVQPIPLPVSKRKKVAKAHKRVLAKHGKTFKKLAKRKA